MSMDYSEFRQTWIRTSGDAYRVGIGREIPIKSELVGDLLVARLCKVYMAIATIICVKVSDSLTCHSGSHIMVSTRDPRVLCRTSQN